MYAGCGRLLLFFVCGIVTIYVHRVFRYVKVTGVYIPCEAPCLVVVLFLCLVWLTIWQGTTLPGVCSRTEEGTRTEWLSWQSQECLFCAYVCGDCRPCSGLLLKQPTTINVPRWFRVHLWAKCTLRSRRSPFLRQMQNRSILCCGAPIFKTSGI
jgi:hypothetical protein